MSLKTVERKLGAMQTDTDNLENLLEQKRRADEALEALRNGRTVKGVVGNRVVEIRPEELHS